jgi:two-component system, cell cycle response regulator CpdR
VARILVIDDDAAVRELMAAVVMRVGHSVDVAANGAEALAFLERATCDLIVCDLKMPVLDGAGLYEQIRNRWPALRGRLLFVSGSAAMPEYADFLRTAQPYILPKPFAIAHLAEAVQRMLDVTQRAEA